MKPEYTDLTAGALHDVDQGQMPPMPLLQDPNIILSLTSEAIAQETGMLNRRELIKRGALTVVVLSGTVPGLRATAQTLRIRENITDLKDDSATLRSLRQFVAEMRARPAGKVPNWTSLYEVHGKLPNGFNLCQHRNWYLFPWHRAYIEMYENMVRDLTGNQGFAMPYWDWTALRSFPTAFTVANANGKPNPLVSPAPGTTQHA